MYNEPLTEWQLKAKAPSIFATQPYAGVSSRYAFIPTIRVIDKLSSHGFLPVSAREANARNSERAGYMKHVVRFRHTDHLRGNAVGELLPEIVVTNAHDATAAYHVHAGLFRLICLNQMVTATGRDQELAVRHSGDVVGDVIDATFRIIEDVPLITDQVQAFKTLNMDSAQRGEFANLALSLKYGTNSPICTEQALAPRRQADVGTDLWSTFNVLQENLSMGGQRYRTNRPGRYDRHRARTRPIKEIGRDIKFNKDLWHLASTFQKEVLA